TSTTCAPGGPSARGTSASSRAGPCSPPWGGCWCGATPRTDRRPSGPPEARPTRRATLSEPPRWPPPCGLLGLVGDGSSRSQRRPPRAAAPGPRETGSAEGGQDLLEAERHAILHDQFHVRRIRNILQRVPAHHDQVGDLAGLHAAELIVHV